MKEGNCSRCNAKLELADEDSEMTAGYYVADAWSKYCNTGEKYVCDRCMWTDKRFIVDYGRITSHLTIDELIK